MQSAGGHDAHDRKDDAAVALFSAGGSSSALHSHHLEQEQHHFHFGQERRHDFGGTPFDERLSPPRPHVTPPRPPQQDSLPFPPPADNLPVPAALFYEERPADCGITGGPPPAGVTPGPPPPPRTGLTIETSFNNAETTSCSAGPSSQHFPSNNRSSLGGPSPACSPLPKKIRKVIRRFHTAANPDLSFQRRSSADEIFLQDRVVQRSRRSSIVHREAQKHEAAAAANAARHQQQRREQGWEQEAGAGNHEGKAPIMAGAVPLQHRAARKSSHGTVLEGNGTLFGAPSSTFVGGAASGMFLQHEGGGFASTRGVLQERAGAGACSHKRRRDGSSVVGREQSGMKTFSSDFLRILLHPYRSTPHPHRILTGSMHVLYTTDCHRIIPLDPPHAASLDLPGSMHVLYTTVSCTPSWIVSNMDIPRGSTDRSI